MTRATSLRRTLIVLLVGVAVLAGFGAIRIAAAWTADAAPLEASPIAADELISRLTDEQGRSATLEDRLAVLTTHAEQLESALATAQARLEADSSNAQNLATQLATAKAKLAALERSIGQARAGQQAVVVTTSTRQSGAAGAPEGENGDD
jgi:chromosome segregation ATPase